MSVLIATGHHQMHAMDARDNVCLRPDDYASSSADYGCFVSVAFYMDARTARDLADDIDPHSEHTERKCQSYLADSNFDVIEIMPDFDTFGAVASKTKLLCPRRESSELATQLRRAADDADGILKRAEGSATP